jgi:hypothetical protein
VLNKDGKYRNTRGYELKNDKTKLFSFVSAKEGVSKKMVKKKYKGKSDFVSVEAAESRKQNLLSRGYKAKRKGTTVYNW